VELEELKQLDGYKKFRDLLSDLFQFDFARDLDFGIYRVFRRRRQVVEKYFTENLPQQLVTYLEGLAASSRGALEQDLNRSKERLKEMAPALIEAEGNLSSQAEQVAEVVGGEVADTIRTCRRLEEQLKNYTLAEEQINQVLLLLTDFFGRYYQEGDFIPIPKFGQGEEYALDSFPGPPYRGEDVYFNWATRGLHYVKTDKFLKDYAFEISLDSLQEETYEVRFVLKEMEGVSGNQKAVRFYFPTLEEIRLENNSLIVPFAYRKKREGEGTKQNTIYDDYEPKTLEAITEPSLRKGTGAGSQQRLVYDALTPSPGPFRRLRKHGLLRAYGPRRLSPT
jgi:adenine-specific DNA-methyltransferase